MLVLTLLPLIAWLLLTFLLKQRFQDWGWRRAVMRATLLAGVYGTLSLELLSLMRAVNQLSLAAVWAAVILAAVFFLSKGPYKHSGIQPIAPFIRSRPLSAGMLAAIIAIALITAMTAWFAPPNTYDSLTYHMSRVAHWAQEGGVVPYASGILRQNYMSPGAEMGILHLYVLGRTDRLANFIQWGAMIISLIGVSLVASDLGAGPRGQVFSALFSATLPMGLAQATSTMTDYVTAMWVLLSAIEVLRFFIVSRPGITLPAAAAAAGLAILTKPTAAIFLLPFAAAAFLQLIKEYPLSQATRYILFAVGIVLLLNAGYLARNGLVFGNPFGGGRRVSIFTNEFFNLHVLLSNLLRNASLHAGTPWPVVNDALYSLLAKVHWKLGLGMAEPGISIHNFFRIWDYPANEARATNTIQASLILITAILVALRWKRVSKDAVLFGAAGVIGFVLFAAVFKFDMLGSRYHMPFFILMAPAVGVLLSRHLPSPFTAMLAVILLAGALPALLRLGSRPVFPTRQNESVLKAERLDQYFVQAGNVDEAYILFSEQIKASACDEIGIMLRGDTPEYPLWVLMGAPRSEVVIRWIIARSDPSGSYRPEDFSPCAVICQGCGPQIEEFNGLPRRARESGFSLYLE